MATLDQILELDVLDAEITREWLTIHADMAAIFLGPKDKRKWIRRCLPKIGSDIFTIGIKLFFFFFPL